MLISTSDGRWDYVRTIERACQCAFLVHPPPTHTHTLVVHTIDLSNARASLTWQEMKRLPQYCSALLKQSITGQPWWVQTFAEKVYVSLLVYVIFSMLVSLLRIFLMRWARRSISLTRKAIFWLASIVLLFLSWSTSINLSGPDFKLMLI